MDLGTAYVGQADDLDASEIFGEREHHGVTPLAHLLGLLPEDLVMLHHRRVGPSVDSSLEVIRRLGRGGRVDGRSQLTEVAEVTSCLVGESTVVYRSSGDLGWADEWTGAPS